MERDIPDLKARIQANPFVDDVRTHLRFDAKAFDELCVHLTELAHAWRNEVRVDKELVSILYAAPQVVRNCYLSFASHEDPPPLARQLEDAWVELDRLVLDCLSGPR